MKNPKDMNHREYAEHIRRLTKRHREIARANFADELDAAALRIDQLLMIVREQYQIIEQLRQG